MSFELTVPDKKCGECRFFGMGEDADAYCDIYDNGSWDLTEDDCEEASCDKPEWCLVEKITVTEKKI